MRIELPHRFTCRHYQKQLWDAMDTHKRVIAVLHRRAGKDKVMFNKLIIKAMEKMGNYATYFPTATLGRRALWENVDVVNNLRVIDHIPRELLKKPPNQTNMMINLINGSTIQILGTDNLDVVGGNYYGTVWSEESLQDPVAWDLTRPILAENGGFAWFNGTPRGKNHFYRMFNRAQSDPAWFAQLLTVEDTGAVSQEAIEDERKAGMSEDMIRQEFYCDFNAANAGTIYADLILKARAEGRVRVFDVDPNLTIDTFWDLGAPMNTVVWYVQSIGGRRYAVDVDIGIKVDTQERVARMRARGYKFGGHYLPHDGNTTWTTGATFQQELISAGLTNVKVIPRTPSVSLRIAKMREIMPTMIFHERTEVGLQALEDYRYTPVVGTEDQFTDRPFADSNAHCADSIGYLAEAMLHGMIATTGDHYTTNAFFDAAALKGLAA